jgi:hypothetical protein
LVRGIAKTIGKALWWGAFVTVALLGAGARVGTALGVAAFVAASAAFADWNPAPAERERQRAEGLLPYWLLAAIFATFLTAPLAGLALLIGAQLGEVFNKTSLIIWFVLFGFGLLFGGDSDEGERTTIKVLRRDGRTIPQDVKIEVSVRNGGRCRVCGSTQDLQYDHIVPYSRGGSSTDASNIQLLCGYHNRLKSNR